MTSKKTLLIPILLISLGIGWLLTVLGVVPDIDWVWTIGLASVGILTFVIGGVDKVSVVVGPMFLTASVLSVLRQTGRLSPNVEMPILVIILGLLLLIARMASIPKPSWAEPTDRP